MDMDNMSHSASSSSGKEYPMHMTFYGGHKALILFDEWKTSTWGYYFLSLVGLFLLALFYQWLQARINRRCVEDSPTLATRLLWSCVYMVAVGVAYMLMLAVMTFNGGVFVIIVLGFGIGHFLFNANASTTATKPAPACCV